MIESVQKAADEMLKKAREHMSREVQRLYVNGEGLNEEEQIMLRGTICHILNKHNCLDIIYKEENEATVQVKISVELDQSIREIVKDCKRLHSHKHVEKGRFQNLIITR